MLKLMSETNNPNDKRSKLLELTHEGLNEIDAVRSQMYTMGSLADGDLSEEEKATMLTIFTKLHKFHKPLFEPNHEKVRCEKLGILE